MNIIRRALLALFAFVAVTPALASASYYQPTPTLTALANYGTASPYVVHAWVQSATINGHAGAASYTWFGTCPGTPDGQIYVAAAGVVSGCWVLEGQAPVTGLPTDLAYIDVAQAFTKAQRGTPIVLSLSGTTATPNFDNGQNFTLLLVHASCPCTMANPSTTLIPGQAGIIKIIQSATGNDTLTWGSSYTAAGGVATLTLSTAASARDYFSYYVDAVGNIVLSLGVSNATH